MEAGAVCRGNQRLPTLAKLKPSSELRQNTLVMLLFREVSHTQRDIVETARVVRFSGRIFPLAADTIHSCVRALCNTYV